MVFSGSVGLTKADTGTLILSGVNNYTGGTANNAGTIQVNTGGTLGSTSGALSMGTGSSGLLGTVGNLTVNTDTQAGAFSVKSNTSNTTSASNIGQLSILSGKTLTLSGWSVGIASSSSGSTNTALATGTANTGGTLTLNGDLQIGAQGTAGSVKIFDFDAYGGTGFSTVNVTGLADGYSASFNTTNGIVTVIPEPSICLLGSLGVLALLRRRR